MSRGMSALSVGRAKRTDQVRYLAVMPFASACHCSCRQVARRPISHLVQLLEVEG